MTTSAQLAKISVTVKNSLIQDYTPTDQLMSIYRLNKRSQFQTNQAHPLVLLLLQEKRELSYFSSYDLNHMTNSVRKKAPITNLTYI